MTYPNIKGFPGGAANDLVPNLQQPGNPRARAGPEQAAAGEGHGRLEQFETGHVDTAGGPRDRTPLHR
jgi:hypothetical protein